MESVRKNDQGIKIRISGLSNGIHYYHFSSDPSVLDLSAHFREPIEIDAHLDKSLWQIYLKVEMRTSGLFECDRCLDEFTQLVTAQYGMVYVDGKETSKYPPEEVQVIPPGTVYLDLSKDIREMVMLSIPLKLLCNEECKGLCPHCGTNRNTHSCNCAEEVGDPILRNIQRLMNN